MDKPENTIDIAGERIMENENQLYAYVDKIFSHNPEKLVISRPRSKAAEFKKIVFVRKLKQYQIEKYTDTQVFHENISFDTAEIRCIELIRGGFAQVNAWSGRHEFIILISKKGSSRFMTKENSCVKAAFSTHDREKNYILKQGTFIEPLVDMGVLTKDGVIKKSMGDKFRQINRFLEIIDDEIKNFGSDSIKIVDFGCGKSYLTFVLYYYLKFVRNISPDILGLDLKEDVVAKCSEAAEKYGYDGLNFRTGDIGGFEIPSGVDMIVTLHACDTATDYALYSAIRKNVKMIFSVPCCQHELNSQISPENLNILSRYGIISERFCALATDAVRAEILEYMGYKTQLLEFVDLSHTPKNIMIRAVKQSSVVENDRRLRLDEVRRLMKEFSFMPALYKLLEKDGSVT